MEQSGLAHPLSSTIRHSECVPTFLPLLGIIQALLSEFSGAICPERYHSLAARAVGAARQAIRD